MVTQCEVIFHTFYLRVFRNVLHGGLRTPAKTNRGSCGVSAVGEQGQVSGNHHLLPQLAVHRQLSVKAVPLQV